MIFLATNSRARWVGYSSLKIKNGQITSLDQVVERVEKLIDNSDKVVKLLQERKKSLRDNK